VRDLGVVGRSDCRSESGVLAVTGIVPELTGTTALRSTAASEDA
jgi:hypothetical protein